MTLVTIIQKARELGVRFKHNSSTKEKEEIALRAVYEAETGRDPTVRFTSGIAKAQWEYGLPGTEYFKKEKRSAVIELSERK